VATTCSGPQCGSLLDPSAHGRPYCRTSDVGREACNAGEQAVDTVFDDSGRAREAYDLIPTDQV